VPYRQPAYRYLGYRLGSFPEAEAWAAECLSLPLGPDLTPELVDVICAKVLEAVNA
jgi:dTDP-4-amino-4,6-dideoxygalactose transaminase